MTAFTTRRQCCLGLLAALVTKACASGPLAMSPERERDLGREEAREVERTTGLVQHPKLVAYVTEVGARLAAGAAPDGVAWQFQVADDPEPNAFALPGGWVYVSRGLLVLVNREDELAGILGHEIGHVVARHSVRRVSAATPLALAFGVPAALLGVVSPTLGGIVGGAGQLATGFALAPYSREQEREADQIGMRLAARAGWNPAGLADALLALEREERLAGRDPGQAGFFATHPSLPERVGSVRAAAGSLQWVPVPPIAGSRSALLARLEGLVVGANPAYGIVSGSLLLHPGYDLSLAMPARWKTRITPAMAGAAAPDGGAVVILQGVAEGDDPVVGARAEGLPEPLVARLRRTRIGGLPAAQLMADSGENRLDLTWVAHRGRVVRIAGISAIEDFARYREAFDRTSASARPLAPLERQRILEDRLRVVQARPGESVADVVARGGATWSAAQLALANGIETDTRMQAGWPVKIAIRQRYEGSQQ